MEKGFDSNLKAGKGPAEPVKDAGEASEAAGGDAGGGSGGTATPAWGADSGEDGGWIGWESSAELIKSCVIIARSFRAKGGPARGSGPASRRAKDVRQSAGERGSFAREQQGARQHGHSSFYGFEQSHTMLELVTC